MCKGVMKINNDLVIDLKNGDNEIIKNFGEYQKSEDYYSNWYSSKKYPIQLIYTNEREEFAVIKNKINDIFIYLDPKEYIDRRNIKDYKYKSMKVIIDDLVIDSNTSSDKIIDYFNQKNIKYITDESWHSLTIEPLYYIIYSITYIKNDLNNHEELSKEDLNNPDVLILSVDRLTNNIVYMTPKNSNISLIEDKPKQSKKETLEELQNRPPSPGYDTFLLKEDPAIADKIIRLLKKGEKLEILQRRSKEGIGVVKGGYDKVRTEKGEIGWVKDENLEEVK